MSGGLVYLYCVLYQGIDQEEYGGAWELLKEGMMTAFAMFMVHHNTKIYLIKIKILPVARHRETSCLRYVCTLI